MDRNKYYENEIEKNQTYINKLKDYNEEYQKNIDDNFFKKTMENSIKFNLSSIEEFENQIEFYKSQIK